MDTERQFKERLFKRHDQFDYQSFGINEFWYARVTVEMLVSFYMEVNGLFEKDDPVEIFSKLFSNFDDFIVFKGLSRGKIKFNNVVHEDEEHYYEPGEVDFDRAQFRKEDLLTYIENNNVIKLDVDRLRRFLSCDEVPNIPNLVISRYSAKNVSQCTTEESNAEIINPASIPDKIDPTLWSRAEKIIRGDDWQEKYETASIKTKNGMNAYSEIRKIKIRTAYNVLWYLDHGCQCISTKLVMRLFSEMKLIYPDQPETPLKKYVVDALKKAMKSDTEAITRIVRLKGVWQSKWLKIQCKLHSDK